MESESTRENQRNAERYRLLADMLPVAVFEADVKANLTYINRRSFELYGYTQEDFDRGMNGFDMIALEDRKRARDILSHRIEGGSIDTSEYIGLKKDGSTFPMLFDLNPIFEDGNITGYRGVIIDISERKRLEDALRRRTEFDRLITLISSDLAGATRDEVDSVIDRALATIGEYSEADRVYVFEYGTDGSLLDNTHEWCAPGISSQIENLKGIELNAELPWFSNRITRSEVVHIADIDALPNEASLELDHFRKQGIQSLIVVPMESTGRLIGFLGFDSVKRKRSWNTDDRVLLRFVGELFGHALARRRAESEKDKTQALFEAAIAQSPSGILIADAPEVTIRLANTAALGIRSGKAELLNGIDYVDHTQTWQTLRTDGTLYPAEELPLTRAVRRGEVTLGEEVIILDDAGQKHWVIVNAAPIRDSKGRITSGIVIQHDISARKRVESERVQIEEQYRQAQKMEAIGQLTGGVAHDFNNLLQVINGATSLALDDLDESHPAHELLTDVAAAGDRAARLVSQLLMFSRRQIMRLESLDLNEVIESLLKMVGRVIGEDIRLEWRPEPDLEPINADRGMIEQAMVNLCVNARDAMSKGGILNIETRNVTIDERFCAGHPWAIPGTYSCISVSDNGHGLDTNALAHIFEPFFTTKGVGKGTGLGLSTVYGIIKQHDGLIHVHSMPDEETVFSLYWPIHNADG